MNKELDLTRGSIPKVLTAFIVMSLRHDTREGAVSDALKSGDLLISGF